MNKISVVRYNDHAKNFMLLAALFSISVLLGGGGVAAAQFNLIVQVFAIIIVIFNPRFITNLFVSAPRGFLWLTILTVAIPLLQVLPLPPVIWQNMPGRVPVMESLQLVGGVGDWRPLSVDVARTLTAFISVVPAVVIAGLVFSLDAARAALIMPLLLALGLLNVGVGFLQLSGNFNITGFYIGGDSETLFGTFANQNSTALFLVLCLVATIAGSWSQTCQTARVLIPAAGGFLILGVVLTHSRSGVALMLLAIVACGALALSDRRGIASRRTMVASFVVVVTSGALVLVAAAYSPRIAATTDRFMGQQDNRTMIWNDALSSAWRFFPIGSGVGTFDEVFQMDESLEVLDPAWARRAHSDWIETIVDGGVITLSLACAWLCYAAWMTWRVRRMPGSKMKHAAAIGLLLVALQATVDYPLRNQALWCVAAMLISLLCWRPSGSEVGS